MNRIAEMVVAFESSVADPRGPNAVCDPMPPNAPARSAALPLCNSTTTIRKMHTITCTIVNKIVAITTSPVYQNRYFAKSIVRKKYASSTAAVSGASDPWIEFRSMLSA